MQGGRGSGERRAVAYDWMEVWVCCMYMHVLGQLLVSLKEHYHVHTHTMAYSEATAASSTLMSHVSCMSLTGVISLI